ncbi:MAG: chemotaxis response regulator protein-glutamate methylesterase [Cyanobacteriota bacterium]
MRIAIVNDTTIALEALRRVVQAVPNYKIAWIASNGVEAISKCRHDPPDLILMDLFMPVMDGVEATRQIMQEYPCAIVVVTATVSRHAPQVFEAMGHGALDAVSTPILDLDSSSVGGEMLLSKIATIGKLIGKSKGYSQPSSGSQLTPPLVLIGASTGGPQAIAKILSQLDPNFPAAIVVVQHIDQQFVSGLVEWLKSQTKLPIEQAIAGSTLKGGKVLVAGSNDHLVLQPNQQLAYTRYPLDYLYRPSVDIFFKSVAQNYPKKGAAVLLTGIGKDGAEGMLLLRSMGWYTIAQEQSSCVVYGMPKAAANLKAAVKILRLEAIASALKEWISSTHKT